MAHTHTAEEHVTSVVTSHNRRCDASGVLCGFAPRLYDLTDRVQLSECSAVWYIGVKSVGW
jgi:hypothetical protein